MTKQKIIEALCTLCSHVGAEVFQHEVSHDCFCADSGGENFQFDNKIIEFIQDAVTDRIFLVKMIKEKYSGA